MLTSHELTNSCAPIPSAVIFQIKWIFVWPKYKISVSPYLHRFHCWVFIMIEEYDCSTSSFLLFSCVCFFTHQTMETHFNYTHWSLRQCVLMKVVSCEMQFIHNWTSIDKFNFTWFNCMPLSLHCPLIFFETRNSKSKLCNYDYHNNFEALKLQWTLNLKHWLCRGICHLLNNIYIWQPEKMSCEVM